MSNHVMPTYARQPITFTRGEGAWLWDTAGKRYLDAVAGIAVCSLGHAHPAVHQALSEQSKTLLHTSNLYQVERQQQLADKLCALSGMDNVFFCNSGTEANEAAIKLARKYGHARGIERPVILTTEKSFHGRTMGALSATGNAKIKAGFEPLLEGFVHVAYNDVAAIEQVIATTPDLTAILLEPVQGEGGVNIPAVDYLNQVRALCDKHDLLLMLDEIQTGIGRTGQWFAFQHNGIVPDVCTLAKALGNGVPIGACMAHGKAAEILQAGNHGSTFGGNPLACAAALAVLESFAVNGLIEQAQQKGQAIANAIREASETNPHVVDVRQIGLMIGIELDRPCGELVTQALQQGLLINVTADNTIRLLPPLVLDGTQIDLLSRTLSALIKAFTLGA
jgi:acetylornithine/N-succinyldiaminopimelate aminotransferase